MALTRDQLPEGWDGAVVHYETTAERLTGLYVRHVLAAVNAGPGVQLLDAAAGAGAVSLAAARLGADVLAVDFSPLMIDRLRARAAAEGLTIRTEVGDCQSLNLPAASRDAITCNFGALFFPDPAKGFREMHRILRPGGVAVVTVWAPWDQQGLIQAFGAALSKVAPDFKAPEQEARVDLSKRDVFEAALLDAGFGTVQIDEITETNVVDSPTFFEEMIDSNPIFANMVPLLTPGQIAALPGESVRSVRELFGEGHAIPMVANVAVARKAA